MRYEAHLQRMLAATVAELERVRGEAPRRADAWRVFTYRGAVTASRPFPSLPNGWTFGQLVGQGSPGWPRTFYILRDAANPSPWSERAPGAQARVTLEF